MERVTRLLRRLIPRRRWRIVAHVDAADELPASIPHTGAVLVGPRHAPKWLAFTCPCRAGHQVMLNLDRRRSPSWTVSSARRLTVSPSIDAHGTGRRCHYFITRGTVRWVPDTRTETRR